MGDEDQAYPLIAQLAHQGKEHFDFLGIKARGRLIKDQHFRGEIDRPANRDNLLHRDGKTVQRFANVQGEAIGFHQPGGPRFHLFASQQAEASWLTADKQVIRHRHIRQQVHFLVNRPNPQLLCMGGVFWRNGVAF